MGGTPQAFLSYTRLDDQGHDGGITALRAALELQVRIVTGDDGFEIFQDMDGIAFGERWPERLEQALAAARFLIPVLSPRFFRSEPCRDALRKFLAHERAAGGDLILPIYLVRAPVLEQPHLTAADDLAAEIAQRQRWDWRPHAFGPAADPVVKRAVRGLAESIGERLDREAQPTASSQRPPRPPASPPQLMRPAALTLQPGELFRDVDESWCPEMVVIPAGSFTMGSPPEEEGRRSYMEGPQRAVTLARPFALGRYTVTFAEWDACVAAGGCGGYMPDDSGWGRGQQPVINVSWNDAQAFVAWLAERTGQPYRLPTEAEWEYAARAGTTTPFWTGATISTGQANYDGMYTYGRRTGVSRRRTVAVDDPSFPANPFGLHHVHGNVWEWVQDCSRGNHEGAPTDGFRPVEDSSCPWRFQRGGSWLDDLKYLRSACRHGVVQDRRGSATGFRVARALTP